MDDQNAKSPAPLANQFKRLLPYLNGNTHYFFVALMAVTIAALTEPLVPALMQPLLDKGVRAGQLELWKIPVAIIGLFSVRGFAGFCAQYCLAAVSNRTMVRIRKKLFSTLQQSHPSLFSTSTASSLVNTLVYEVQTGAALLVHALLSLFKDSLTLLALLGYLLYVNWKLTLIVFAVLPAVAIVMKLLTRRLQRITKKSQDATDELGYTVEENVLAYRTIRLHNAQAAQVTRFEVVNNRLSRLAMKATIANAAMTPLTQMLAAVALSIVICIALWQNSTSGSTVGGFVAFTTAMLMLVAPIKHLSEVAGPITRGLTAIERGLDLLEKTPLETGGAYKPVASWGCGEIVFSDVGVQYPTSNRNALHSINLHVKAGETIAIVGGSGSGKTTLVNVLARFVDTSRGQVLMDGIDIRLWDLNALRQQLAFVSQDVIMLNDTVAANVALGTDIDVERVHAALEGANLTQHIASLSAGIDSMVGHNANQLSGGQRQRLAIARAIYKQSPVLVLDEATSALDAESELAVKSALKFLTTGRTTLIIAHRFSTIEHADRIVMLGDGSILEIGTHAELIAKQGAYYALYKLGTSV